MKEIAKLCGVTHKYQDLLRETLAVEDLNITINEGEFVAIVGPSGCGKTTLLSIISGMIKPTSGIVEIAGKTPSAKNCNVGYMLQHDHLFEWQTIMSNTLIGLKVRNKLNDETRLYAEKLLDRYGLSDFKNAYPGQLSGGMRQKAALIRTLALNPDLLLLDEPFSALDFQTRLIVSEEVNSIIRSEKKTAVLVTHDISEAVALCDRVYVLTKRPASVKAVHEIELESKSSFERRRDPMFNKWFDIIWHELDDRGGI